MSLLNDAFNRLSFAKLALRAVRALERSADALCDIRDLLSAQQGVGVNRDDDAVSVDGVDISYSDDASTYARELSVAAHEGKFGRGQVGPWGI